MSVESTRRCLHASLCLLLLMLAAGITMFIVSMQHIKFGCSILPANYTADDCNRDGFLFGFGLGFMWFGFAYFIMLCCFYPNILEKARRDEEKEKRRKERVLEQEDNPVTQVTLA